MVVLLALSFIPSAFMVYLTNEKVSQEQHMQSISGVGAFLYWSASFIWDMVSCPLTFHPGIGTGWGKMGRGGTGVTAMLSWSASFLWGRVSCPLTFVPGNGMGWDRVGWVSLQCFPGQPPSSEIW